MGKCGFVSSLTPPPPPTQIMVLAVSQLLLQQQWVNQQSLQDPNLGGTVCHCSNLGQSSQRPRHKKVKRGASVCPFPN